MALDRALAVDPDYRLARLLERMVRPGDPAVRGARLRPVRSAGGHARGRDGHARFTLLRQVMSPSISPGLLGGNPPPRWGAPGDDPAVWKADGKRGSGRTQILGEPP